MKSEQQRPSADVFTKVVDLSGQQNDALDRLKTACGISYSAAIRRGIELVEQEFAPVLKARGARIEV